MIDGAAFGTSALLAGFLVPFVSLIKRPTWGTKANYAVALGVAFICAVVGAIVDGHIKSPAEFIAYLGVAITTSQTIYNLYFASTDAETTLRNK